MIHPEYGTTVLEQAARLGQEIDASLAWDDVQHIRDRWKGKLIVKGVMTAEDAGRCCGIGADALVVSNHGGRQPGLRAVYNLGAARNCVCCRRKD